MCEPQPFATTTGTGEITGTARNWVEWSPYTTGTWTDPVENPFVALSDAATDQTLYVGRGDAAGNFDIQGVPPGDYNLAVWDEQLSYIMRFKPVHIDAGATVDVNETDDDGNTGLGVSRWFGIARRAPSTRTSTTTGRGRPRRSTRRSRTPTSTSAGATGR